MQVEGDLGLVERKGEIRSWGKTEGIRKSDKFEVDNDMNFTSNMINRLEVVLIYGIVIEVTQHGHDHDTPRFRCFESHHGHVASAVAGFATGPNKSG